MAEILQGIDVSSKFICVTISNFQEKTGRPVISVLKDEELHQMENMAKRLTTLAEVKGIHLYLNHLTSGSS